MLQVFFVNHDNQRTLAKLQDKATHDISTSIMSGDKKAKAFLHATKHCRTVSTFLPSTFGLIKFRQPMAEKTVGLLFITRGRLSYANDAEDPETLTAVI